MKVSLDILRKKESLVALLAGIAVAVAVGVLLARFVFRSCPPDVVTADLSKIAEFTQSEAFLRMNSKERGEFADAVTRRYLQMTPEEQAQTKEMFSWLRQTRAVRESFWIDWAAIRAKEYEQLSPDEQEAYVDHWLGTLGMVMTDREMQRMPYDEYPSRRNMPSRSQVKMGQDMRSVLTKTSAEDRPRIAKLTGAVVRRVQDRYER